jgi:hypothetical protein
MHPHSTRFALLRHEFPIGAGRQDHWDLLLEQEGVAWTWQLADLPPLWSPQGVADTLSTVRLPDHRLHYLEYEGPIAGDRGWVTRVAGGTCQWVSLEVGSLCARLTCPEWSTQVTLVDLQADNRWRLDVLPATAL